MKYRTSVLLGVLLFTIPNLAVAHDGPDGTISHRRNEVRSQSDATTDWHEAEVGEQIYKQGRVNTLEESTAAVLFRDEGSVAMRENTLLIVYGHHAMRNKKLIAMEAELERGTLRARLGELEGESSTTAVATPSTDTTLEGGNSLIKVDEEGTSRVHNHGDGNTTVNAKRGGQVAVARGMGVKVKRKKRASKPIPLPPTPAWVDSPEVFLGVSGRISEVRGSWGEVSEARSYYIEVATDQVGIDVISAVEVPSPVDGFEIHGLPVGDYHVRVASVDDDQFESIPSEAQHVELVEATLEGPGGIGPFWPEDGGLTPVPVVLPGTALGLPADIRCGASPEQLEARPVLIEPGIHELTCQRDDGTPVAAFAIEVPVLGPGVLDVELDDAAAAVQAGVEVPRGRVVTREVVLDTDLELPEQLYLKGPEGVEIQSVVAGEEPGSWVVTLLAGPKAPEQVTLGLSFVDDQAGSEVPPFAEISLTVFEPEPEPEPEPELKPERHMFEFGIGGGLALLSGNHGLFRPSVATHNGFERPAGEFVLRAGYYPIRWVGVEIDGRVIPARVNNGESATAYSARAQLVGQLPYRVTPFIAVGGELLGVSSKPAALGSDTDVGAHLGGGLKVYVTRQVALRLSGTGMFHEGLGDARSVHFEIDLGLSFVLGRRSAGRKPVKN